MATVASKETLAAAADVAAAGETLIDQLFVAGAQSFNFTLLFAVHAFSTAAVVVPSAPEMAAPK